MKRAVSLSFILLANMFLLAHVIIPCQHDHDTIICACFPIDHCTDGEDADNRQHGENCPVDVDLYVRHKNIKAAIDFCPVQYPLFLSFSKNPVIDISDFECLPFRQKPYLLTCHTDYIACSLGLRAPPAC
jgi:hypothetical protein